MSACSGKYRNPSFFIAFFSEVAYGGMCIRNPENGSTESVHKRATDLKSTARFCTVKFRAQHRAAVPADDTHVT
ncbi:hypothetical protein EIP86_005626 [Pleurotus ostreatoroseus]|nr:hypothetical protein EIP86_005626 [Pleurotus ostreatoroseus]